MERRDQWHLFTFDLHVVFERSLNGISSSSTVKVEYRENKYHCVAVADIGEGSGADFPLFCVKKEEITGGRKKPQAKKNKTALPLP